MPIHASPINPSLQVNSSSTGCTESVQALHFILPVWGGAYIKDWLELSVASQLAQNNLPALTLPVVYHVVTDAAGQSSIQAHQHYQHLSQIADVRFHDIQVLKDSLADKRQHWRRYTDQDWFKYALKMAVIQYGCELAFEAQAGLVVLMSDIIFANHALKFVEQQALDNVECVLVGSFRVKDNPLREQLLQRKRHGVIAIDPQPLQDLAIPLVHPYSMANSRDSSVFNHQWCDYLYWHEQKQVILQRGVFCYPLYMDCRQAIQLPTNETIDTCELPFSDEGIRVVTDSRECFLFTPSGEEEFAHLPLQAGEFDAENIAYFIEREAKRHHRKFMQQPVVYATSQARAESTQLDEQLSQCASDFAEIKSYLDAFQNNPDALKTAELRVQQQFLGERWWLHIALPALALLTQWQAESAHIIIFGSGIETNVVLHHAQLTPHHVLDNDVNKQYQKCCGAVVSTPATFIKHVANDAMHPVQYRVLVLSRHYAAQMQHQLEQLMAELPEHLSQPLKQNLQIVNLYK